MTTRILRPPTRTMHPTAAFAFVGLTTAAVLFASSAPSPIYPVYQQLWGFSSFTLTAIFAIYVVALLGSLLTVGSLSDHVGRRPVIAVSLAMLIVAMFLFISADGVGMLLAARILQGLATGAVLGALSAAMLDLQPNERIGSMTNSAMPGVGLAFGVIVAGTLVQYAPAPRLLVYAITAGVFVVLLAALVLVPESSARVGFDSRAHLARTVAPRAALPVATRPVFLAAVPAMVATWSLGGLQLSLGSSIVDHLLGVANHASAAAILFTFFASAAIASLASAGMSAGTKLAIGYSGLFVGLLITLAAVLTTSIAPYIAGLAVSGFGFGTTFVGVIGSLAAATAPADRGQVFASMFLVSYTGFAVPAVVAGLAAAEFGLRSTAIGYAIFVLALVLLAAAAARRARPAAAPAGTEPVCVG
ncbi:MFS transporter [Aldersonia sp. NBC_00410]|uniref:MFS transporter n=1 Tax=Aldersonia sp. NBC_00410 TaxID=2975954 RepID=UPI00225453E0|nr:MFS transporter [Aldersonia sp. NBC_00410]MCX5044483.1 MFS transporter [Aldersonia sp. NBC_00410]